MVDDDIFALLVFVCTRASLGSLADDVVSVDVVIVSYWGVGEREREDTDQVVHTLGRHPRKNLLLHVVYTTPLPLPLSYHPSNIDPRSPTQHERTFRPSGEQRRELVCVCDAVRVFFCVMLLRRPPVVYMARRCNMGEDALFL